MCQQADAARLAGPGAEVAVLDSHRGEGAVAVGVVGGVGGPAAPEHPSPGGTDGAERSVVRPAASANGVVAGPCPRGDADAGVRPGAEDVTEAAVSTALGSLEAPDLGNEE